jgi:hypothetical protein
MRNFQIGDIVICVDDEETFHLTKNKRYEVLNVHESIAGILVQLLDDCNEIYSFEKPRFISLEQYREQQLEEIFA